MADLDDFFAKKDRKKSKVKKFATAEELAKRIEDSSKKVTETKPRKVTPGNADESEPKTSTTTAGPPQEEEEWKEFEEEEKRDYSGLKLAQLNINEDDYNQTGEEGSAGQNDTDGERSGADGADRKGSGAWRKVEQSAAAAAAAAAAADTTEKQQQQQPAQRPGSSLYVTPAMKNLRTKGKKGVAPDLKSEEFFPTLGSEAPPDPSRSKKDTMFEEVKHGGRVRQSDLPSAAPLSVGNRFTSLSNDAS